MIRGLAAVFLLVLTLGPANAVAATPNIVYILADDLGYGDVQCLNPQRGRIKTPHLDRLASEGMTFTDAHSGSSVCTPTRYGLLTGRYAWRTRLQNGVLDGTDDPPLIADNRLTVATLLKQQGYATACIGKWHLGFTSEPPSKPGSVDAAKPQPGRKAAGEKAGFGGKGLPVGSRIVGGPITRGFDYFWGCSNARTMSGLIENDRVIETIEPVTMLPRLEERAVAYIDERTPDAKSGKPFFLYLPLTSPHTPILPSAQWQGKSGLGDYGDFVMQTDAVVGRVLAQLERNGLARDTLVIFTADNGCSPQAGTKKLEEQGHFASAAYRGYKADIWEGGHRVPFFVRWPDKVKPASQSSQLICHVDFLATCAELLAVKLPASAGEDSVSILPALLGTDRTPLREAVVHHSINGRFSIRQGPWKLEFCGGSGGWGKPGDAEARKLGLPDLQLYDLSADSGEQKNLAASHPEVVARLSELMRLYVDSGRSTPGDKQSNDVGVKVLKAAGPALKE
ncbi:sulfatase family protein [Humisphaera borealis]|uniref:Arylsulfatase n=1 Tax=Humisphaera borealis TaxID=2807512 RepID=A0A7M2X0D5_9BACT|nr:arylsulfatase [Humisphaera borealis]QOV91237.1 arylsulfatase [Humisphaera borealis]